MTASPYTYRLATVADTELITDQRTLMFAEIGVDTNLLKQTRINYVHWIAERLSNGIYTGIMVEYQGKVIAGAGMCETQGAPSPILLTTDLRRCTIVNVYTDPEHRRKGIARELVTRLIDIAREKQIPIVTLHASDAGRPLYESMGFSDTKELNLYL